MLISWMHGALRGTQVVYLMRCFCVDLEGDLSRHKQRLLFYYEQLHN
jgi:hypothetical protein